MYLARVETATLGLRLRGQRQCSLSGRFRYLRSVKGAEAAGPCMLDTIVRGEFTGADNGENDRAVGRLEYCPYLSLVGA